MEEEFGKYLQKELDVLFGNSFRIQGSERLGGGCISNAAKLITTDGQFFLKWHRSAAPDLFVREAEGLCHLKKAAQGKLIIPQVILAAEAGKYPGFIVLELLDTGPSQGQEEQLGTGLAVLHRYNGTRFGFDHDNYCGATPQKNEWKTNWIDFFATNRLIYLLDLIQGKARFELAERKVFDRLIHELPRLLPASSMPSLIHGDLWSGNYLYTGRGPALIDPAACYADREMELSMMSLFGGFSAVTWQAYQHAYPLDAGWADRIQIYQIYHLLNHYYLFGGSYGRQALAVAKKFAG
ncbi:MAG: fructosamine kinase family protein [Prolixibacteraceae bacterium]